MRAAIERSQDVDMLSMMPGSTEAQAKRFDDVEEMLNIPYVNREEVPLAMDVFKPADAEGKELPVVVTIHGGGFTMGDRRISRPFGRLLAHKGYLVFSVEYRLAPKVSISQGLDDVCCGLDLVGERLVDFDVDFNRVFMVAESAGAYLAAYACAMGGSQKLQDAIGHQASRMKFKAAAFNCGMFYTNEDDPCGKMLSEQIYDNQRFDQTFLEYMNPEHPEIINNLPPAYIFTSRADFLNNYSFKLHDALKAAGKVNKLVYYPNDELIHAFLTLQTFEPTTLESIDSMLEWLEDQAVLQIERSKKRREEDTEAQARQQSVLARIEDKNIRKQNVWQCVKEIACINPAITRELAIMDCTREYTYEQMFNEWENYARVFGALGITGEAGARVGIAGAIAAEPLFAFFGLNMVGATVSMLSYPDFLPSGTWKTMVRAEKLTDLILTDIMVTPDLWRQIEAAREELGLRNVILVHSRMGGPCVGPAELTFNEFNYHALRRLDGTVFMGDLLAKYAEEPVSFTPWQEGTLAIITHTSGTTKGTRKPLPYTNEAFNAALVGGAAEHMVCIANNASKDQKRYAPSFDFSSFLCVATTLHCFATGDTAVLTFFGFMHPKFIRAVDYYQLTTLFTSGFMIDTWLERTDLDDVDLSSLKVLACGGSYVPPAKLQKYKEFFKAHGCTCSIVRGYGMSEAGGTQLVVPVDSEADILGFPQSNEDVWVQDEVDQQFYRADEGVRTGTLYLASDSLCCNELDGQKLFDYTQIEGKNFLCTNDLVRVNADGSLSYAGRADRYFVNNEGVRFEAGVVEAQMSAQPCVNKCAVVPVLDKRIHDTVPVLYVVPTQKGPAAPEAVRLALVDVFVTNGLIHKTNLPSQFVLVDSIPCNSNGKIDVFRITRERLAGDAYNIVPVHDGAAIVDVAIEHATQLDSITGGTLPEGMGASSAFGVYDMFNPSPAQASQAINPFNPFDLPKLAGLLFGQKGQAGGSGSEVSKERKSDAPKDKPQFQMPLELISFAMKASGLMYGRKDYDRYIEE